MTAGNGVTAGVNHQGEAAENATVVHGELLEPRRTISLQTREADAMTLAGAFLAGYGSDNTRSAYRRDLDRFFAWCHAHALDPFDVERAHVEVYARELEARGRTVATVARHLSTLAGFYRYAVEEDVLGRSPVSHVRRPRVGDESPTLGLDRDELGRLLDAAERRGARDAALICLLGLCGLRVSEACAVDIEHIGEQRGHRTLTVVRKGNRRALVPLPPRALAAVDAQRGAREGGPLLLDNDAARPRSPRCHPHRPAARARRRDLQVAHRASLRHSFVTLALEAGVPLHRVQDTAGHADPRQTRRYDRARHALDGHASYALATFLADG